MISGELAGRIDGLCEELIGQQEEKLRRLGRRLCPDISLDDLYCPDDVPRLREDPQFIYEHGLLAGLSAAAAALRALIRDLDPPEPSAPGED